MPGGVAGERSATLTAPMPISTAVKADDHRLMSRIRPKCDMRTWTGYDRNTAHSDIHEKKRRSEGRRSITANLILVGYAFILRRVNPNPARPRLNRARVVDSGTAASFASNCARV